MKRSKAAAAQDTPAEQNTDDPGADAASPAAADPAPVVGDGPIAGAEPASAVSVHTLYVILHFDSGRNE